MVTLQGRNLTDTILTKRRVSPITKQTSITCPLTVCLEKHITSPTHIAMLVNVNAGERCHEPLLAAFADFHGANTPTFADFKPPI